ncbi:MAG TPA: alpha/beta hydrolase, partial [Candidatus Lustribacter sp.]|nr:alpha/beta hydrolase [Candidatus Lustribacter sp.]
WPACEIAPWALAKAQTDVAMLEDDLITVPWPWREVTRGIAVPTLLVTGDHEVIFDPGMLAQLAEVGNPLIETAVVPRAGHCVRRDQTEAYHRLVDAWIEGQLAR